MVSSFSVLPSIVFVSVSLFPNNNYQHRDSEDKHQPTSPLADTFTMKHSPLTWLDLDQTWCGSLGMGGGGVEAREAGGWGVLGMFFSTSLLSSGSTFLYTAHWIVVQPWQVIPLGWNSQGTGPILGKALIFFLLEGSSEFSLWKCLLSLRPCIMQLQLTWRAYCLSSGRVQSTGRMHI